MEQDFILPFITFCFCRHVDGFKIPLRKTKWRLSLSVLLLTSCHKTFVMEAWIVPFDDLYMTLAPASEEYSALVILCWSWV